MASLTALLQKGLGSLWPQQATESQLLGSCSGWGHPGTDAAGGLSGRGGSCLSLGHPPHLLARPATLLAAWLQSDLPSLSLCWF